MWTIQKNQKSNQVGSSDTVSNSSVKLIIALLLTLMSMVLNPVCYNGSFPVLCCFDNSSFSLTGLLFIMQNLVHSWTFRMLSRYAGFLLKTFSLQQLGSEAQLNFLFNSSFLQFQLHIMLSPTKYKLTTAGLQHNHHSNLLSWTAMQFLQLLDISQIGKFQATMR